MLGRWLGKKIEERVEEKAPESGLGQVIDAVQSQVQSGESGAILLTKDGVQRVEPEQPSGDEAAAQLLRLTKLHDRGALTDAEFEAQKRQITGG